MVNIMPPWLRLLQRICHLACLKGKHTISPGVTVIMSSDWHLLDYKLSTFLENPKFLRNHFTPRSCWMFAHVRSTSKRAGRQSGGLIDDKTEMGACLSAWLTACTLQWKNLTFRQTLRFIQPTQRISHIMPEVPICCSDNGFMSCVDRSKDGVEFLLNM